MTAQPRLPDFLIVGAMKAGTTSLSRQLAAHPGIHMPDREVHFFDREDLFRRGHGWYAAHLTAEMAESSTAVLLGEKTPAYSYLPHCAARIHDCVPAAKLVWIFREPVWRTFSNYLHARKKGVDLRSFPAALAAEAAGSEDNPLRCYVARSRYAEQVKRFLDYFPREAMHFLLFEDLVRHPEVELGRLTQFLGVAPLAAKPPQRHANRTRMPFSVTSMYLARRLGGPRGLVFRTAAVLNGLLPGRMPELDEESAAGLRETFAPLNAELAGITGLDLGVWQGERGAGSAP